MNFSNDSLEGWDDDRSLEEFLAQEEDHFHMEYHFLNWTQAGRPYPILLPNFDALWERLPEVFAFLGFPFSAMAEFPERKPRKSDWKEEPDGIRRQLQDMHGELEYKVEAQLSLRVI